MKMSKIARIVLAQVQQGRESSTGYAALRPTQQKWLQHAMRAQASKRERPMGLYSRGKGQFRMAPIPKKNFGWHDVPEHLKETFVEDLPGIRAVARKGTDIGGYQWGPGYTAS